MTDTPIFTFPNLPPVAFSVGPIQVHWYALAYVVGVLLGWAYMRFTLKRHPIGGITNSTLDDAISYIILGILVGGRLGYIVFYQFSYFANNPLEIFMLWHGGMSFHGGAIGVVCALMLLSYQKKITFLSLLDLCAIAAPIGLFFGRLANFINGELYGRLTQKPWGIIFPGAGGLPRHPSQLYEAVLEGLVLFLVLMFFTWKTNTINHPGRLTGIALVGYGLFRSLVECVREPDASVGYIAQSWTMGQLLSLPLLFLGVILIIRARHAPKSH